MKEVLEVLTQSDRWYGRLFICTVRTWLLVRVAYTRKSIGYVKTDFLIKVLIAIISTYVAYGTDFCISISERSFVLTYGKGTAFNDR